MVNAILSLISNSLITGLAIIGAGTLINKAGKFFKIIEEEKQDGYRKGFDSVMIESIDEINKCVESVGVISTNLNKIFFIMYDITTGNKFVKKDKDGKIIICSKSKLYSGYKDKIDELSTRVKKYQDELKKVKKVKKRNVKPKQNDSDSSQKKSDSDSSSDSSSDSDTDADTDADKKDDEFFLDNENTPEQKEK